MKIESNSERTARIIAEAKTNGGKVPGRTLPRGYEWNGLDQPGCGAAKRRLRQAQRQAAKDSLGKAEGSAEPVQEQRPADLIDSPIPSYPTAPTGS